MADDVLITAGTGTTIATDDVAGRHFQRFKQDLGGDGATVPLVLPGTGTLTSVAASITSVTLKAANVNRLGLIVFNDGTADLYAAFAATATTTAFTAKLTAGEYLILEFPCYSGIVTGIWSAANGSARVTELTA